MPEDKKSKLKTEFMYMVRNPSNLPILISGLKLNSMERIPGQNGVYQILWHEVDRYTSTQPLMVFKMPHTYCSLDSDGDTSITFDGELCFGAKDDGLTQGYVPDQLSMFHTFDVRLAHQTNGWEPRINSTVNLYTTNNNRTLYGIQGYVNCGAIFHTYSTTRELFDANNGLYTDFTTYGDMLSKDTVEKFNKTVVLDVMINENNELVATASREATLDISVSGTLHGHIRCVSVQQPELNIWGHYFKDTQKFSSRQTMTVGSVPVAIDNSALADAFEDMRDIEYYSLLNAFDTEQFRTGDSQSTTIREYLKPNGLDITIEASSADGAPVVIRFSGQTTYEHKLSPGVKWPIEESGYAIMVPSTYPRYDSVLLGYECPPSYTFMEETIKLKPKVTYVNARDIYYMIP